LLFAGLQVGFDKTPDGKNVTIVQLGAILLNTAPFPIAYVVKRIRSTADATTPSRGTVLNWGGVVQPGLQDTFKDRPIDLKTPKNAMDGTFEIDLLYGRPGAERYPMSRSLNITLRYDVQNGILHHPWLDAPRANQ
jgi:hypothetical protein